MHKRIEGRERGTLLLVVLFIATAIAALATITSGRAVSEIRTQSVLEDETRSYNQAFAQLHLALNLVNTSGYDNQNHNMVIRGAIEAAEADEVDLEEREAGEARGAKSVGESGYAKDETAGWLDDPEGVIHGMIPGTTVRVYHARDYIKRLQKLRGEPVEEDLDSAEASDSFFVLEGAGLSGDTVRLVSALVRENEPFSSFVFFQNRHPLGVSGQPRGLIHANDSLEFYFPEGKYIDPVSAVNGFAHRAGASAANTTVMEGNPNATAIKLEAVDFDDLKAKAGLYTVADGLDAEIRMYADGRIRIRSMTKPRWDLVEYENTRWVLDHYDTITETRTRTVQTGTVTEEYEKDVIDHYVTETYTKTRNVYERVEEEYEEIVPVYEDREVTKTKEVPVYATRTVTKTRWIEVFVPYNDDDASGGTAVGGSGGVAGEYEWVEETYEEEETYIDHYDTETYTVIEPVKVGETTVTKTRTVKRKVGTEEVEKTREVPVYVTVTQTREVPVYSEEEYELTYDEPVYAVETYTESEWTFQYPEEVKQEYVSLGPDVSGTIFVDGRITRLYGDLNGRLTIVGNEKVRVTDNIRYVDKDGQTTMLNGGDYTRPYERNPDYQGTSVLGVIARDDLLLTRKMPSSAEVNATLLSVEGRVGIDGFAIKNDGEPTKDYKYGMTAEEKDIENNYNKTGYKTRRFKKDSLRRIGGIISNDRILETYIRPDSNGNAYVDAGFKRGSMKFDINLLFNPPPNFIQVPRPVIQFFTPVFVVRNQDT